MEDQDAITNIHLDNVNTQKYFKNVNTESEVDLDTETIKSVILVLIMLVLCYILACW